jgi:hypothetical protein
MTSATCSQLNDAVNAQNREAGLSTGMYFGAAVLGAAAVVIWTAWPKSHSAPAGAFVTPVLGPGVAGLSGGAAF